jgi:hypothetical protein
MLLVDLFTRRTGRHLALQLRLACATCANAHDIPGVLLLLLAK